MTKVKSFVQDRTNLAEKGLFASLLDLETGKDL